MRSNWDRTSRSWKPCSTSWCTGPRRVATAVCVFSTRCSGGRAVRRRCRTALDRRQFCATYNLPALLDQIPPDCNSRTLVQLRSLFSCVCCIYRLLLCCVHRECYYIVFTEILLCCIHRKKHYQEQTPHRNMNSPAPKWIATRSRSRMMASVEYCGRSSWKKHVCATGSISSPEEL